MFLICLHNSLDRMFKRLWEFFFGGGELSMVNYYLAMFDAILVTSGDMKYFICHVIPQNHVIEGS